MSAWRELGTRLAAFVLRRRQSEGDLQAELNFHLAMAEDDLRRQGLDPVEARRRARLRLGGRAQIADAIEDQRTLPFAESLLQDVRYAVRTLSRTPAFTIAAILTVALGIAANTAIFTVLHALVLRPLPYANGDRLVVLGERQPDGHPSNLGFSTFADLRDRSGAFEAVAAIRSWEPTLVIGEAERLKGMRVSWNYFDLLGVRPAIGRGFRKEEDHPERWRVLLLSDGLWRRRFSGDPSVVGRTVRMNDRHYQVIGVMPPSFEPLVSALFYRPAEVWAPLGYDAALPYACRNCRHTKAVGRLREGVTLDAATADLDRVRTELRAQYPREYGAGQMTAVPLAQLLAGPVRGGLYVLSAAVGFVLLIACANVANLLLARSLGRRRELAVRTALGAGRGRLVRQMITESLVLSAAGGTLGVWLASLALPSIASLAPLNVPGLAALRMEPVVLLFAAGLSALTGLLFGVLPALRATSTRLLDGLTAESRGGIAAGNRARQTLVIADIALALVLLTGAGLMMKSLVRLMRVDPGFQSERVLTMQLSLVGEAYREDAPVLRFLETVVAQAKALPGVEGAAVASQIPMGGNGDTFGFHIQGLMHDNPANDPEAERYSVTADYFGVMGIPLKRGRLFTETDTVRSEPVLIVSESTERALFRDEDPIGQRVRIGSAERGPWRTIVGVVGDVHHSDLTAPATPQLYVPQAQFTDSYVVLTVKAATRDPVAIVPALRAVVRQLDPTVPIYDVASLDELVARSFAQRRFVMTMLSGFALLALLLAAVGLYGVVAYSVAERTREVGVRMALGARAIDIVRLVLGSGAIVVLAGLAAGVLGAALLTRFLGTLLFGVHALDPAALGGAVVALFTIAALAHSVPLRRALRVDPAVALRRD